ncbi:MAG: thermonuclease family protein [Pseudomonadota bacterium]
MKRLNRTLSVKSTPRECFFYAYRIRSCAAVLLVTCSTLACSHSDSDRQLRVDYVVDGDTVVVEGNETIRLAGINAPEYSRQSSKSEPFALEALLALRERVDGTTVNLVSVPESHDQYGRTLAYLEDSGGRDVQLDLILRGYGYAIAWPPNVSRAEQYFAAESRAREAERGVWSQRDLIPVRAEDIDSSGFNLIVGTVISVQKTAKSRVYNLRGGLKVFIDDSDWNTYWNQTELKQWTDQLVEVRGWVFRLGDNFGLKIRHPLMLKTVRVGAE